MRLNRFTLFLARRSLWIFPNCYLTGISEMPCSFCIQKSMFLKLKKWGSWIGINITWEVWGWEEMIDLKIHSLKTRATRVFRETEWSGISPWKYYFYQRSIRSENQANEPPPTKKNCWILKDSVWVRAISDSENFFGMWFNRKRWSAFGSKLRDKREIRFSSKICRLETFTYKIRRIAIFRAFDWQGLS